MTRLDYSRAALSLSFVSILAWFHVCFVVASRNRVQRFAVAPYGRAKEVTAIDSVSWIVLPKNADEPITKQSGFSGLVVDLRSDHPREWEELITKSALSGVPVYNYKQVSEMLTGQVRIDHLSENNLGSLIPSIGYFPAKRGIDLVLVLAVLPFLCPLFAIIALMIKIESAGPVFFRQERMGYEGKSFTIWKFRSMHLEKVEAQDPVEAAITRNADTRITNVGKFIRRTRLDELPQLINILRGEMSWVGPRPEAVPLANEYERQLPFYAYRHIVRPGITGWAQVNQGHVTEIGEVLGKLHFDFYYIKNFSAWLDALIMLRTIRIVLVGFGAK